MSRLLRKPSHGRRGAAGLQGQGRRKDRRGRPRVRRRPWWVRASSRIQGPGGYAVRGAAPGAGAARSVLPARRADARDLVMSAFRYPVTLGLERRSCLVVGGGVTAEGKVTGLLEAGARVTVISPRLSRGLAALAGDGHFRWQPREFMAGDTEGFLLVMVATGDGAVNRAVADEARRRGAPELITVRGLGWLRRAEVVVYDHLVSPALLDEAPAPALRIFAGKLPGRHCVPQEAIHGLLIHHALAGQLVVRLKGGDPFVF